MAVGRFWYEVESSLRIAWSRQVGVHLGVWVHLGVDLGTGVGVDLGKAAGVGWCMV